ncbi:MAG: tRNA (guanosine(46)-N7)-methyltransferase TrmB [Betaproteobacteria bacterium]
MNHQPSDIAPPVEHRPIRSFVLRQGRMSPAQTRAVDSLGPAFVLPFTAGTPLATEVIFGRAAPLIVEIGFGMGEATAAIAKVLADKNFIGIEVHTPGVGALLKLIGENDIHNLRIIQHDAVEVLTDMIADGSLSGLHIFFPDPWPKKRHHKRRLIQPAFVKLLVQKLSAGGYLHLATDWEDYAQQMLEVLGNESRLRNSVPAGGGFAPRPAYRGSSSFERKGLAKGHGVWDLVFIKA